MKISKELTSGKGLYVGAYLSPESVAVLRKWCDDQGIPHNVDDSHITVIYSKSLDVEMEGTIDALTDRMDDLNDISITPTGLKYLGKNNECLVLSVKVSGDIMELRQIAMDGGFEPTYAEYQPHVTLFDGMEKEIDYTFSNLPDTLECDRFEVKNLDEDKFESTIDQKLDRLMARRGETPEQFNKTISRGLAQLESADHVNYTTSMKVLVDKYGLDVGTTLYHATPRGRVSSVMKNGLKMSQERSTDGGEIRGVYLTTDDSGFIDGTEIDDPVVIAVDVSSIMDKIFMDPEYMYEQYPDPEEMVNEINGNAEVFAAYYAGNIPANCLSIHNDSPRDWRIDRRNRVYGESLNYDNVPDHLWRDMPIGDFKKQIQSEMPDQKIYYDTDVPETIRALWYNRETQNWILVGVYDQETNQAAIDTSNTVSVPKKSGGLRSLFYQNENRDPIFVESSGNLRANNMTKRRKIENGAESAFISKILPKFQAQYPGLTSEELRTFMFGGGQVIGTSEPAKSLHHDYDGEMELMVQDGLLTPELDAEFQRIYDGLGESVKSESIVKLVEADVARSKAILAVGDFIKTGQPGSAEVLERVESLLKINGLAGASFEDAYVALQALNDDDLNSIYDFALGRGMDDLAGKKEESSQGFREGDHVVINNYRNYDSLGGETAEGTVMFTWPDGRVAVSVGNGQSNVNAKDLVKKGEK